MARLNKLSDQGYWNLFYQTAPTSVTGVGANNSVTLSWTAPGATYAPPALDYIVQYSTDSGSTWTTFTDGVATGASTTVTGLTSGTAYVFRVAATNGLGQGAWSATSAGVTPGTDPYFSNVSLLLHMDGSNGSTTFTDSSPSPKTVTAYGGAAISTAQSKFNGASCSLINAGDYLTIPKSQDFEFSTGDFTVEAWVWFQSLTDCLVVSLGAGANGGGPYTGWTLRYMASYSNRQNALLFYRYDGSETFVWSNDNVPISAQNWHHVAVSRASSTLRFFVDGAQVGTASSATSYNAINSDPLYIGRALYGGDAMYLNGYIDDLRITKGIGGARYTANFTPPDAAFPDA